MRRKRRSGTAPGRTAMKDPLAEGIPTRKRREKRNWAAMGRDGLVEFARRFISENGINGRRELDGIYSGLYQALRKEKLLDEVGLKNLNESNRSWRSMSDDALVAFAMAFIEEDGITGRRELEKADRGLYDILWKRKLLGDLGLDVKHKNWASMSDERLLAFGIATISMRGIGRKEELRRTYPSLFHALWRRSLLEKAFSDDEGSREADALYEVVKALGEFG